ncbi:MAG: hypothetical protein M3256_24130, partial [Actinomycetota bacterium]|nr:hypothetical protein [Actinomycetota bacterium]
MSGRYSASGKRISSMTHAKRSWTCTCGKVVTGNGGKSSHRRACAGTYLGSYEAYQQRLNAYEAERAGKVEGYTG